MLTVYHKPGTYPYKAQHTDNMKVYNLCSPSKLVVNLTNKKLEKPEHSVYATVFNTIAINAAIFSAFLLLYYNYILEEMLRLPSILPAFYFIVLPLIMS